MRILSIAIFLLLMSYCISFPQSDDVFDERIWELIDKMELNEKIIQLNSTYKNAVPRLGLPEYDWHNEALHGLAADSVTIFPTSVALAATFDTDLMYRVATAISDEGRAFYNQGKMGLNYWSPNMDIVRDPRWGRNQETYGEDPYLCSRMGVAFVTGMQGDDPVYLKTITTPKHFAVHSGPEHLRFEFDPILRERDIWETYMPPFKAVIEEAGSYSIMTAYSAYKGFPISLNEYLIRDLLRGKWGFDGYVNTDCGALSAARWNYGLELDDYQTVARAIKIGVDLECGNYYHDFIEESIALGYMTEDDLDTTVYRVLKARFKLGLFDPPEACKYNQIPDSVVECHAHRELALEASRKSMVLLKNDNNILPLDDEIGSLFVTGPNADSYWEMLGAYGGMPSRYWTPFLTAIRNRLPNTEIEFLDMTTVDGMLVEIPPARHFKTPDGMMGLKAEFFDNPDLEGEPVFSRIDTTIDFHWERISPVPGVRDGGAFSVRWSGTVTFDEDGIYTFVVTSNDGARLYIDSNKIVDSWWEHGNAPFHGTDTLKGGVEYDIVLEYFFTQSYAHVTFEFGGDNTNEHLYDNARDEASKHDAIIFVGGNTTLNEMEMQDRTTMEIAKGQMRLLKKLKQAGVPIIFVLYTGSAMSINWIDENCQAVLNPWYGGQEAGIATVEAIFGDYTPGGKLPITFYRSDDDLPEFTDYSMENRSYRYFKGDPLYPFGFGLSYAEFEYSDIIIPQDTLMLGTRDSLPIAFTLTNTGEHPGDEVVQLYVSNMMSEFEQPIKQLKGFKRIHLEPGGSISDTIMLAIDELYYYNEDLRDYRVEPGVYELQLASSSKNVRLRDWIYILDSTTVSVDENTTKTVSTFSIYPNPAKDKLNIKLEGNSRVNSIAIYDVIGRKINAYQPNERELNISNLPKGIYLLKIETDAGIISEKVAVE